VQHTYVVGGTTQNRDDAFLHFAPPVPEIVADTERGDLIPLEFSKTKIECTPLVVRGIGPWSAHYLMMRSFGFLDCMLVGDTGLGKGQVILHESFFNDKGGRKISTYRKR